jgi:chromosome transmission fidelity protein 18
LTQAAAARSWQSEELIPETGVDTTGQGTAIDPSKKAESPAIKPKAWKALPIAKILASPKKSLKAKATSSNFLGVGARKAKAALTARKMERAGLNRSNTNKVSHTGSGIPQCQVMRLKYVKGFTQAVRVPCRLDDLA